LKKDELKEQKLINY